MLFFREMCFEEIACPRCSSTKIKKNGKTANRKQRYQCKDCGRQFITAYSYLGRMESVRELIVPMTLNGCGVRDISRVLLVSSNTVLKTLRTSAAIIAELSVSPRIRDLEIDEFWSFVGSKRRPRWTWYGFDRQRRRIVAHVNGRRTDQDCFRLMRRINRCQVGHFHTDGWPSYRGALPQTRHTVSRGGTLRIERHNLNFRTRLKRLQRRTNCFSRSEELHDAIIKLFVHHSSMS
jgi:insertion element IS1 protein InsB